MDVLLSIKPKYVEAIMKGEKRYEFRKTIFKNKNVQKVYIYSTSPVKKIVGYFIIGDIIEDHPNNLWEKCKKFSGISDTEFFNYFNGNERGFAIRIDEVEKFNKPLDPTHIYQKFIPPQSFYYFNAGGMR